MDVWDTARPGKPPRVMTMAGWGGECFSKGARLLLTHAEAHEMYARTGDAEWTVEQLIPVIEHELRHGTRTTTSIRMTGLAA